MHFKAVSNYLNQMSNSGSSTKSLDLFSVLNLVVDKLYIEIVTYILIEFL